MSPLLCELAHEGQSQKVVVYFPGREGRDGMVSNPGGVRAEDGGR